MGSHRVHAPHAPFESIPVIALTNSTGNFVETNRWTRGGAVLAYALACARKLVVVMQAISTGELEADKRTQPKLQISVL
jgi:hypothetical protein